MTERVSTIRMSLNKALRPEWVDIIRKRADTIQRFMFLGSLFCHFHFARLLRENYSSPIHSVDQNFFYQIYTAISQQKEKKEKKQEKGNQSTNGKMQWKEVLESKRQFMELKEMKQFMRPADRAMTQSKSYMATMAATNLINYLRFGILPYVVRYFRTTYPAVKISTFLLRLKITEALHVNQLQVISESEDDTKSNNNHSRKRKRDDNNNEEEQEEELTRFLGILRDLDSVQKRLRFVYHHLQPALPNKIPLVPLCTKHRQYYFRVDAVCLRQWKTFSTSKKLQAPIHVQEIFQPKMFRYLHEHPPPQPKDIFQPSFVTDGITICFGVTDGLTDEEKAMKERIKETKARNRRMNKRKKEQKVGEEKTNAGGNGCARGG